MLPKSLTGVSRPQASYLRLKTKQTNKSKQNFKLLPTTGKRIENLGSTNILPKERTEIHSLNHNV